MDNNVESLLYYFVTTEDEKYALDLIDLLKNEKNVQLHASDCCYEDNFVDAFLFKDSSGKSIIEYILDSNIKLSDLALNELSKSVDILKVFLKYHRMDLLKLANGTVFFEKINDREILLEYMIRNNLYNDKMISNIDFNDKENIKALIDIFEINNQTDLFMLLSQNLLFYQIDYRFINGSIMDYIIKNMEIKNNKPYSSDNKFIKKITDSQIYSIIIKYNKKELLPFLHEVALLGQMPGKEYGVTILECLLKEGIKFDCIFDDYSSLKVLKKCINNLSDIKISERLLFETVNGKKLIDMMLENNIDLAHLDIKKVENAKYLVSINRLDLLAKSRVYVLVKNYDLNTTFLDLVLDEFSKNPHNSKIKIATLEKPNIRFLYEKALQYIIYARHGLVDYLPRLKKEDLFLTSSDGKKLIDYLFEIDKELTINKIISENVKSQADVAIYLRLKGIDQKNINLSMSSKSLAKKYMEDKYSQYDLIKLPDEQEKLLKEFEFLMIKDGKSDYRFIQNIVRDYRMLLSKNNKYAEIELKKLIEIKSRNNELSFRFDKTKTSHYSSSGNYISIGEYNIETINHEMGHMLYDNLVGNIQPYGFIPILLRVINDENIMNRVSEYSARFHRTRNEVSDFVEEQYMKDYDKTFTDEKKAKVQNFLNKSKAEKIEEFSNLGYPREQLEELISESYTMEEYIEQDRRVKKGMLIDTIMRCDYPGLSAIGDILDALFMGQFRDEKLKTSDGEIINHAYGHGINYYERHTKHRFNEMFANYSMIAKSPNGEEMIAYLRSIVGDELVDFLVDQYENVMLKSNTYEFSQEDVDSERMV